MPFVKNKMVCADSFYECSNLTEITISATTHQGARKILFNGTPIYGLSLPFGDGIFTISVKKHDPIEFAEKSNEKQTKEIDKVEG